MKPRATYDPVADDVGTTLRVEASYDAKGNTRTERVRGLRSGRGVPTGVNVTPVFPRATESRSVDENKANASVGSPITAIDLVDRSKLTYTLERQCQLQHHLQTVS